MATYRDDYTDDIYISDSQWVKQSFKAEETCSLVESTTLRIRFAAYDALTIADSSYADSSVRLMDEMEIGDTATFQKQTTLRTSDNLKLTDQTSFTRPIVASEAMTMGDSATLGRKLRPYASEKIAAKDSAAHTARAATTTLERLNISDSMKLGRSQRQTASESIQITDTQATARRLAKAYGDSAKINDTTTYQRKAGNKTTQSFVAKDLARLKIKRNDLQLNDAATVSDSTRLRIKVSLGDSFAAADLSLSKARIKLSKVNERIRILDDGHILQRSIVSELAEIRSSAKLRLKARHRATETLLIADSIDREARLRIAFTEAMLLTDNHHSKLSASNKVSEGMLIESLLGGLGFSGQLWTANTENWGMSRYYPYTFKQLFTIGDTLYGCNDDGVFQLSKTDNSEVIAAKIETGKIDVTDGTLSHPTGAYIEYEVTDGDISMDVTSTQAGSKSTYNYELPKEQAEHLTNGRFIFGKGLRGRHFSFDLNVAAKKAHFNDAKLEILPIRRRT